MKRAKEKQDNKVNYSTISLPVPLINLIKKRIKGTGINSVSSYVAFVLRQILSSPKSGILIDKKDEEEVRRRLESLGY